ncbi:hypothetical protein U1Q18_052656 [Sarracenia purpurea var. burkii]
MIGDLWGTTASVAPKTVGKEDLEVGHVLIGIENRGFINHLCEVKVGKFIYLVQCNEEPLPYKANLQCSEELFSSSFVADTNMKPKIPSEIPTHQAGKSSYKEAFLYEVDQVRGSFSVKETVRSMEKGNAIEAVRRSVTKSPDQRKESDRESPKEKGKEVVAQATLVVVYIEESEDDVLRRCLPLHQNIVLEAADYVVPVRRAKAKLKGKSKYAKVKKSIKENLRKSKGKAIVEDDIMATTPNEIQASVSSSDIRHKNRILRLEAELEMETGKLLGIS